MYITLCSSTPAVIKPGGMGTLQAQQEINIPEGCTGIFSCRLANAKKGLFTSGVFFHGGWTGRPQIVVTNLSATAIEFKAGEEIGEVAILTNTLTSHTSETNIAKKINSAYSSQWEEVAQLAQTTQNDKLPLRIISLFPSQTAVEMNAHYCAVWATNTEENILTPVEEKLIYQQNSSVDLTSLVRTRHVAVLGVDDKEITLGVYKGYELAELSCVINYTLGELSQGRSNSPLEIVLLDLGSGGGFILPSDNTAEVDIELEVAFKCHEIMQEAFKPKPSFWRSFFGIEPKFHGYQPKASEGTPNPSNPPRKP